MGAKSWVVTSLLALSFIAGAIGQYFFPGVDSAPTDLWLLPAFAFLVFLWYRIDSVQRAYKRSPWLNICVIGFALLALPYYFFRSRGFKGGTLATAAMLALFIFSGVLTGLGQYATYYGLQR